MNILTKNDIIEFAVQIENNGFLFYDNAAKRADIGSKAKELLLMLRDEEKVHKSTFEQLRNKLDLYEIKESSNWADAIEYVKAIVSSHIFTDSQSAINLAVNAKDESAILINAIEFEKDTILFFYAITRFIENKEGLKAINDIIDEETNHILRLKKYL